MSDRKDKDRQDEQAQALDSLAAATAVGFAVASRTMEMWFGVMSGFARASRQMIAPHLDAQLHELERDAPEPEVSPAPARESAKDVVELSSRRKKAESPLKQRTAVKEVSAEPVQQKRAPEAIVRPEAVDDLKRIAGIGPKLEQVLNGFGVWTFAQVAAWQPEEIAWLDDTLGLNGRIGADNWLEQADALGRAGIQKKDVAAG